MKKKLIVLLALCITLLSVNAQAQVAFVPDTIHTVYNSDPLLNPDLKLLQPNVTLEVHNTSFFPMDVIWKLRVVSKPTLWDFDICDDYVCGGGITTNLGQPMIVDQVNPGKIKFSVYPNAIAGCAHFEIDLYDELDMTTVISTGVYLFSVYDSCGFGAGQPTSITEIQNTENISIFPNPAYDYFSISSNNLVEDVEIFNIMGKSIRKHQKIVDKESIDISTLPNGLYFVRMTDKKGRNLKNVSFIKK